jgi:hypothetical protein
MLDISYAYTGEVIHHPSGQPFAVLDTARLNFDTPEILFGKKITPTKVRVAQPQEEIVTTLGTIEESRTVAAGGELVFINLLPDGTENAYIPRDANGTPNGAALLEKNYTLIGGDIQGEGAFYRPISAPCKLMHEVIATPTVIAHAWGEGQHQFLEAGATLKYENGRISAIHKHAFDATWSLTDARGRVISEEHASGHLR